MDEEEEYRVYKKFFSIEEAAPLLELLQEKGVDYRTNNYNSNIGSTFASRNNPNQVEVKLLQAQFEIVDHILEQEAEKTIGSFPPDYYLFSFSDDDLMEVLRKPDEWTKEDYLLSQQLLKKHGKLISAEMLNDLSAKRLEELRQPEKGSTAWNMVGYVTALLGGFLGIIMGWYMMSSKKTLPNGESIYTYDSSTRDSGKRMFYIGIVSLIIWFIWLFVHFMPR